jgi:hypothetical protein
VAVVVGEIQRDLRKDIKLDEMERKTGRHGAWSMELEVCEVRKSLDERI